MSCNVNTDKVTAVFALGQWHPVVKGTFDIDSYEVIVETDERHRAIYQMGQMYPEVPSAASVEPLPGSVGEFWRFKSPQGFDGCMWRCRKTMQIVAMSLLEIKAWRHDPE